MNEYDLSDAITELLQGNSSKTALSVSEVMMQWTGEYLDVDRRMPVMTWTEHWVARNSRHVQWPQGDDDNDDDDIVKICRKIYSIG